MLMFSHLTHCHAFSSRSCCGEGDTDRLGDGDRDRQYRPLWPHCDVGRLAGGFSDTFGPVGRDGDQETSDLADGFATPEPGEPVCCLDSEDLTKRARAFRGEAVPCAA